MAEAETVAAAATKVDVDKYREAAVERWESDLSELEQRNRNESHPEDSVLFVGSSSIRRWDDIASDVSPYPVIQRGYGGAKWSDVAVFIDRLVRPHQFRAVVFFVGNDIRGKDDDKTPQEVAGLFSYVLQRVRQHDAKAPVFYVAVTPTNARFAAWPDIKAANRAARAVCDQADHTYFVGTESLFLDSRGQPREELFVDDQLHLNRDGYVRWAAAIKSHLDTVLDGAN